MSMSHKASNLALHNRVCSLPEGGILFPFDSGLHGVDSAGNIIQPLDGAVATLRPGEGRFGGAIAVEKATTNLCVGLGGGNYSIDTIYSGDRSECEFVSIRGKTWVKRNAADTSFRLSSIQVKPNTTYTWSMTVYSDTDTTLRFTHYDGEGYSSQVGVTVGATPRRIVKTFTTRASSSYEILHIYVVGNISHYFSDFQLEEMPFATSFVDGSRMSGLVQVPIQYTENGTLSFWGKLSYPLPCLVGFNDFYITTSGVYGSSSSLNMRRAGTNFAERILGVHWGGVDGGYNHIAPDSSLPAKYSFIGDGWNLYTITWGSDRYTLYINGVPFKTVISEDRLKPFESGTLDIYGEYSMYDDLMILPYSATYEEIQSWYHSNSRIHNNADTYITL